MVGILLVLAVRYLLWRSLSTLNLSTPLNGVFSLGLFLMELLLLSGGIIQLFLLLRVHDRRPEADRLAIMELLYCRPGQWKSRCSPGEFESLGLLLKILFRPRFLFDRQAKI